MNEQSEVRFGASRMARAVEVQRSQTARCCDPHHQLRDFSDPLLLAQKELPQPTHRHLGDTRDAMSAITQDTNTSWPGPPTISAARVFAVAELLEHILLYVAYDEISQKATRRVCKPVNSMYNVPLKAQFIRSPVLLRAVNRDFRDTIDGSPALLKLRLNAAPLLFCSCGRANASCGWATASTYKDFGPLHWLEEELNIRFAPQSCIEHGMLFIKAMVYDGVDAKAWYRLSQDADGSWRKIPCMNDVQSVSGMKVEVRARTVSKIKTETSDCWYDYVGTWEFGTDATLGMIFDKIYEAEPIRLKAPPQ